jgi:small redox-active disulfide protein 2
VKITKQAADQLGIEYELEKLTDIKQFSSYGLMMTPGLVVDGHLKVQGKVPSVDEIKTMLA